MERELILLLKDGMEVLNFPPTFTGLHTEKSHYGGMAGHPSPQPSKLKYAHLHG